MKLSKRLSFKQPKSTRKQHSARRRVLSLEQMETRRLLAEIPVPNGGFEARADFAPIAEGSHDYPQPAQESWRYFEAGGNGGPARTVHPATDFVATAAEGDYVIRVVTDPRPWVLTIGPTAGVAQILTETFDHTKTYDLSAQVSRYTDNTSEPDQHWNGYVVQLAVGGVNDTPGGRYSGQVIGGTVIAQDWNTQAVPFGSWVTSNVQYTPDPSDAALDGQPLQIRLLAIRDPDDPAIDNPPEPPASNADFTYRKFAAFDDVQLFVEDEGADTTPPVVTGVELNAGTSDPADLARGDQPTSWETQRSSISNIEVRFSEPVSLDVDDIRLTNLGIDAPQDVDAVFDLQPSHFELNGTNDVVTLSFSPGELDDGVYQIEVLQTATDLAGNAIDGDGNGTGGDDYLLRGDTNNGFYQLEADWNGDAAISVFDFTTFSYWFGNYTNIEPFAPAYTDLNNDQGISVFDFTRFSRNFGTEIVYQTSFAGVLVRQVEEDVTPDNQEAIEQFVEVAATPDGLGGARERVDDMQLTRPRETRDELELELESVIDVLANDLAQIW